MSQHSSRDFCPRLCSVLMLAGILFGATSVAAFAQAPEMPPVSSATPQVAAPSTYDELLATAKAHPEGANYMALRLAYVASPGYEVMAGLADKIQLMAAVKSGDWQGVQQRTDAMLDHNWTDIVAHIEASVAAEKLGNHDQAALHRAAATGLLRSIAASGDGKSPATAYVVTGVGEQVSFLTVQKLRQTGQSMVKDGRHSYERVDAVDAEGNQKEVYFNMDLVFSAVARALATPQKTL
jgi:hypothetical protein